MGMSTLPNSLNPSLLVYAAKIKDDSLRRVVVEHLDSVNPEFSEAPSSTKFHHTYSGGLMNHTIEVCLIGERIIFSLGLDVNLDHFYAAALLHDAGKTRWSTPEHERGVVRDLEEAGRKIPPEVEEAILGHMGGWSKTGVYPDKLLGTVLHAADLISSRWERDGRRV